MKLSLKALCITLFALFLIIPIASAAETAPAETTFGISQLINGTEQNTDNVIVRGFVSKVFPQDKLISLIDHPDVKSGHKSMEKQCPMKAAIDSGKGCPMAAAKTVEKTCPMKADKSNCSATKLTPTLSVLWDGNMPETATFVKVVGKMTQKDGEMLFVAESIDVMNN